MLLLDYGPIIIIYHTSLELKISTKHTFSHFVQIHTYVDDTNPITVWLVIFVGTKSGFQKSLHFNFNLGPLR